MSTNVSSVETTSTVCIRALEASDPAKICALFTRHTPYQRDMAFWVWLNRTLPVARSIVSVATIGEEIVGHYGILPFDLRQPDGTVMRAGHGVHAFVSPEFRDRVSIFQISAHAYRQAREAGLEIVFGFPNAKYRLVQEKIERWRCVSLFNAWTKLPSGVAVESKDKLEPADLIDDDQLKAATQLWEAQDADAKGVAPLGTARWWLLRYLLHPQRPYAFHWYVRGGERRGLVVTKVFRAEGQTRAHIIDYALSGREAHDGLLNAFDMAFRSRAQQFVHWPTEPEFCAAMRRADYRPDGFETFFGFRPLAPEPLPLDAPLFQEHAWRLPIGFSDAF